MKYFHNIFIKYIAGLLTIIYTFSLFVSLIAGVSHELHHLLSHTLDQHHHHGESHTNQTHQHIDLVDILLDDVSSQKDKKKDQTYLSDQRIFDHTCIKFSSGRLIYPDKYDSQSPLVKNISTQFLSLPDIPPPKV